MKCWNDETRLLVSWLGLPVERWKQLIGSSLMNTHSRPVVRPSARRGPGEQGMKSLFWSSRVEMDFERIELT